MPSSSGSGGCWRLHPCEDLWVPETWAKRSNLGWCGATQLENLRFHESRVLTKHAHMIYICVSTVYTFLSLELYIFVVEEFAGMLPVAAFWKSIARKPWWTFVNHVFCEYLHRMLHEYHCHSLVEGTDPPKFCAFRFSSRSSEDVLRLHHTKDDAIEFFPRAVDEFWWDPKRCNLTQPYDPQHQKGDRRVNHFLNATREFYLFCFFWSCKLQRKLLEQSRFRDRRRIPSVHGGGETFSRCLDVHDKLEIT